MPIKDTKFSNDPITILHFNYNVAPYWAVCPGDASGYTFYIEILPYGRQLIVPELNRVEEAKALTQLEYLANSKELSTLEHLNKVSRSRKRFRSHYYIKNISR